METPTWSDSIVGEKTEWPISYHMKSPCHESVPSKLRLKAKMI